MAGYVQAMTKLFSIMPRYGTIKKCHKKWKSSNGGGGGGVHGGNQRGSGFSKMIEIVPILQLDRILALFFARV